MLKLDQNQQLIIRCSDQYYSYDAYHITAEFFPEKVRAGLIRQETDPEMDTLVRITAAPRELFRFSVPETRTDRKQIKYEMGCSLCDALSELTGKKLPWGILTGVRPTKIARTWLEEGMDQKACIKRFQEELKTSPQRAELAVKVAEKEIELIDKIEAAGTDGLCIYVHIPFCPSRCLYCSFASVPADRFGDRIDAYLDALQKEMTAIAPLVKDRPVSCIYVGGGTPTVLNENQLNRLCSMIRSCFIHDRSSEVQNTVLEWTVEAGRPDTINSEKLGILKKAGVTRISINPQTMHGETLERIGREHTTAQVRDAFAAARHAGFDNINMDLIAGLDGESLEDFKETLADVEQLDPDSVTVHALAVKRASRLGQEKDRPLPAADLMTDMADEARRWARLQELYPYYLYRQKNMSGNGENIGFAKSGKEGLYNILIMEEVQDILAFGAGAVSKLLRCAEGIIRINNVKDVLLYMEQINEMIKRKEEVLC